LTTPATTAPHDERTCKDDGERKGILFVALGAAVVITLLVGFDRLILYTLLAANLLAGSVLRCGSI
jgi:hypothetical protein